MSAKLKSLELESRIPSPMMQDALTAANFILANLGEWEGEAMQEGHRAQDPDVYDAIMREHLADAIYEAMRRRS